MTFTEAVKTCFTKYAVFTGRARRSEYWWFSLFTFVVYIVASLVDAAIGSPIFVVVVALGLLLPSVGVGVRRLHDTSRSGWFYLIGLIPIVGGIILIVFFATDSTPGANQYDNAQPAY
jgi:uncharacterized membrane protein YhaH (DUF805 family)